MRTRRLITDADWTRARASAARALELMPHDKAVRGTIRIIDGQINRIRGPHAKTRKCCSSRARTFDEAAQLMPKSPDPWLGLARLYVYSLHDVDSAEIALKKAEHSGHDIGKRETAQLADGYRDRGERTLREAQNAASRRKRTDMSNWLERICSVRGSCTKASFPGAERRRACAKPTMLDKLEVEATSEEVGTPESRSETWFEVRDEVRWL